MNPTTPNFTLYILDISSESPHHFWLGWLRRILRPTTQLFAREPLEGRSIEN